jgi:hypothetical protein
MGEAGGGRRRLRRGANGIEARDGGPHLAVGIAKKIMGTSRKLPSRGEGGQGQTKSLECRWRKQTCYRG